MDLLLETAAGCLKLAPGWNGVVLVGRGKECDLKLHDDHVSRVHCCLLPGETGDCLLVRDLGSMNGTYINGSRLVDQAHLGLGDELQIGQTICRLVRPDDAVSRYDEPPVADDEPLDDGDVPAPPAWLARRRSDGDAAHRNRTAYIPHGVEFREAADAPPGGAARMQPARTDGKPRPGAASVPPAATSGAPPAASLPSPAYRPPVRPPAPIRPSTPETTRQAPAAHSNPAPPANPAPPPKPTPPAKAAPAEKPPGETRRARRLASLSAMLPTLTRMERRAAAVSSGSLEARPEDERPRDRAIPVGGAPRVKAGASWLRFQQVLDYLWMLGLAVVFVYTAVVSSVLVGAFLILAQDGLSVFVPFEGGGRHFTDMELVQIGFGMAAVFGGAVVLAYTAWKHAEECVLFALGGFAVGLVCGPLVSGGAVSADGMFRFAVVLAGLLAIGAAVLFGLSLTAPLAGGDRIWAAVAAGAVIPGLVLLIWPLRDGLYDSSELTIPMATPVIPGHLIGAGLCAAVAVLLFLVFLRNAILEFADAPTVRWFDGYLLYHIAAGTLSLVFLCLTNTGAVSGWTSGFLGLTAVVMFVADGMLFSQAMRYARYTI